MIGIDSLDAIMKDVALTVSLYLLVLMDNKL